MRLPTPPSAFTRLLRLVRLLRVVRVFKMFPRCASPRAGGVQVSTDFPAFGLRGARGPRWRGGASPGRRAELGPRLCRRSKRRGERGRAIHTVGSARDLRGRRLDRSVALGRARGAKLTHRGRRPARRRCERLQHPCTRRRASLSERGARVNNLFRERIQRRVVAGDVWQ